MKSKEEQLEDYKKFNESKNAFISGMIMGWASRLETAKYDERLKVYKDMREFSEKLAKSAGVIITDEKWYPKK